MASSDLDTISSQVERNLSTFRDLDEEDLLADVGQLALQDIRYAAPLSRAGLVALGRLLVSTDQRIREVVCSNKELISVAIDTANVSALVALLAPTLGFPPTAVPAAVVALAVWLLRIGLNQYCRGEPSTT